MWCLLQRARGREERRRRDGLHVCVQHCGQCIADRAENRGVVRPGMPVELVRRTEQLVSLGHENAGDRQPVATMCRRDGGGLQAMVCKPGVDELECVWMRRDQLSDLLL